MLIIDMPIPKDGGCHIAVDGGGHSFACPIKKKTCDYFFTKERPSWCPIKGVLPDEHGDLIDRDEMFEAINSRVAFIESCPEEEKSMKELFERDVLCTCLHDVVCAKAVIPAERKDMSRYIDAPDQTILTGSARTAKERTESMSIDEPRKPKTVVRHGSYARIERFCPRCMQMLYRKKPKCPNCGQAIAWKKGR